MNMELMKEKFDKKFLEAKILREIELKRVSRELFNKSPVGKVTTVIYILITLGSFFVYWKFFEVNIFLSILYGIIIWFAVTYIFDKILIKFLGVEKIVKKINDEEIEAVGKDLKSKTGISMDKLLK